MNANLDNQPTESSLFEEEPVGSKTDVKDEEKSSVSSLDSKIVKFEESEQLSEYQQTLLRAASQKSSDIIYSKGLSYTLRLMYVIINEASTKLRIVFFGDDIKYLYYKQIFDSINSAIKKCVDVQILSYKEVDDDLCELYGNKIKKIPNTVYEEFLKSSPAFRSFVTGDEGMYRFDFGIDSVSGLGSFNDPDMTSKFNELFDQIYKQYLSSG